MCKRTKETSTKDIDTKDIEHKRYRTKKQIISQLELFLKGKIDTVLCNNKFTGKIPLNIALKLIKEIDDENLKIIFDNFDNFDTKEQRKIIDLSFKSDNQTAIDLLTDLHNENTNTNTKYGIYLFKNFLSEK